MIEKLTLLDYVALSYCYLLVLTPKHLMLAIIGIAASLPALRVSRRQFITYARSIIVFILTLLFWGLILNLFWNIFIFDKYYWQYDYAGWECSPFRLLIYEELQNPARYFHGTHEKTIRNWHSVYLILSWSGAYMISLFLNQALNRRSERANKALENSV